MRLSGEQNRRSTKKAGAESAGSFAAVLPKSTLSERIEGSAESKIPSMLLGKQTFHFLRPYHRKIGRADTPKRKNVAFSG
jgi:hypothetical protein